jgi:hypothetical protein
MYSSIVSGTSVRIRARDREPMLSMRVCISAMVREFAARTSTMTPSESWS